MRAAGLIRGLRECSQISEGRARPGKMTAPFDTEEDAVNWAIDLLREHGFSVTAPAAIDRKCSVKELRARCGNLLPQTFDKRLHHRGCPWFKHAVGPSGRILWLIPNPDLITWLCQRR